MKKLLSVFAGAVIVSGMMFAGVHAETPNAGQIEGGDIYRAKNVTDGTAFEKNIAADPCEVVQFKVRIHNPGPRPLNNVVVKAGLSSGASTSQSSTVTLSADNSYNNAVVTGTAGVTLSKASEIKYVPGTAELLDNGGSRLSTLSDSLVTSGANIGSVEVSLNHIRYVQFQAKVDCPTVTVKQITVCDVTSKKIVTINENELDTNKHSTDLNNKCAPAPAGSINVCVIASKEIVTIKENEFDAKKHTKDLNVCAKTVAPVAMPTELPKTGANGIVIALVASLLAAGSIYGVRALKANKLG